MRNRNTVWTIFCCGVMLWAGSRSWGFEDGETAVGLSGILPAYAPEGLEPEDFDQLVESIDDTWKDWARETGTFVQDFYEGNHNTIEAQRNALQRLQVKLNTMEKALSDSRYRGIHDDISPLYAKLQPRVELAEGMLDVLTMDVEAARDQRLQPAYQELDEALANLKSDLREYRGGQAWLTWAQVSELEKLPSQDIDAEALVSSVKSKLENRESYSESVRNFVSREPFLALEDALADLQRAMQQPDDANTEALRSGFVSLLDLLNDYRNDPSAELEGKIRSQLDELRLISPDGGALIAEVVSANYLNYNLRIAVTEGLLNRFYSESRQDSSWVNDRVMEAHVTGYQCTDARIALDLIPSSQNARFAITLSGTVRSNTNGYTSQATIHTVGTHSFSARKPVMFDGQSFYLEPATVSVNANNRTVGARTKFSGVPILGGIANRIAMREATSRTPQANAIARNKIADQVRNQLNNEAGQQFANASSQLQAETYAPLRKYDLYPDVMSFSTTDSELRVRTRLMASNELAGSKPAPMTSIPSNGMVAQIHETLLTNSFDRLGLNGQTMTEDEVRALLEERLSEILNREVKFPQPEPSEESEEQAGNTLVFDETDPVRFTVGNGEVTLIIRAGLKRDNGEDIPTQIISVPFTPTMSDGQILLTRGTVSVRPVSRPPSVAAQVTRAQVMRQKIQSALPERTIDSTFEIETNNKKIRMNIASIEAYGGWLTLKLK